MAYGLINERKRNKWMNEAVLIRIFVNKCLEYFSDITGSNPGQARFQDFEAQKLA